MRLDDVFITGLGTYLPDLVTTKQAVELGLYDASDVELSGWESAAVAGDMPAPEMAVRAARLALDRSTESPEDIDLMLHACTNHQGPDGWSPQHYILRNTLDRDIPSIEIRQGCTGLISGMELAASYLAAAPTRTAALITSADNFGTPLVDRWRSMTNILLGDAAAAVVLSKQPGFAQLLSVTVHSIPALELLHRGTEPLFPPGCTVGQRLDLQARASDYGRLQAAAELNDHELIGAVTAQAVKRALADATVDISEIARVTHVSWGHERFLRRTMAPLGLETWRGTLEFSRRVGHLGASDQVAGLDHLLATAAVGPGDLVMMIGVGIGVSIACAVVRIVEQPSWTTS